MGGFATPARDYFRDNLKTRMVDLDLSDSELGRRIGVAPSTIGRWLIGERYPSLETLEKIAPVLGLTAAELIADPSDRAMAIEKAWKTIEAAVFKGKKR